MAEKIRLTAKLVYWILGNYWTTNGQVLILSKNLPEETVITSMVLLVAGIELVAEHFIDKKEVSVFI